MSTETNKMMFSYGSVDLAYELKFFHTEKSIYTILKSNMNFNLKNDRMISVRFQGKSFNITVIQVYAPTSNAEEAEVEQLYEDLQDFLEITPKKDVLFITGDWSAKVGSQETPGVTGKFGLGLQNEAGQRLIEFCQENALVIASTLFQQHKRRLYTWTSPDGKHQNQIDYSQTKMEKLYTVSKNKTRSWLWLRSWTPYCQIQTEIEESGENHYTIQVWSKSNSLWLHSGSKKQI